MTAGSHVSADMTGGWVFFLHLFTFEDAFSKFRTRLMVLTDVFTLVFVDVSEISSLVLPHQQQRHHNLPRKNIRMNDGNEGHENKPTSVTEVTFTTK